MRVNDWLRRNFERIWESEALKRDFEIALCSIDKLPEMSDDDLEVFFINRIIAGLDEVSLNLETMIEGERRVFANHPGVNEKITRRIKNLYERHTRNPDKHDKFSFDRTTLNDIIFVERKFNEQ